jgi:hypothetical protein
MCQTNRFSQRPPTEESSITRIYPGKVIETLFDYVAEMKQWPWEIILGVYTLVALIHIVYMLYEMEIKEDVEEKTRGKADSRRRRRTQAREKRGGTRSVIDIV